MRPNADDRPLLTARLVSGVQAEEMPVVQSIYPASFRSPRPNKACCPAAGFWLQAKTAQLVHPQLPLTLSDSRGHIRLQSITDIARNTMPLCLYLGGSQRLRRSRVQAPTIRLRISSDDGWRFHFWACRYECEQMIWRTKVRVCVYSFRGDMAQWDE